jgi:hypothetical protein
MAHKLSWEEKDFNVQEAKDGPYTFVVWNNKSFAELRIIRKENVNGMILPMQDFSVFSLDAKSAKKMAQKISKMFHKVREYNKFEDLF